MEPPGSQPAIPRPLPPSNSGSCTAVIGVVPGIKPSRSFSRQYDTVPSPWGHSSAGEGGRNRRRRWTGNRPRGMSFPSGRAGPPGISAPRLPRRAPPSLVQGPVQTGAPTAAQRLKPDLRRRARHLIGVQGSRKPSRRGPQWRSIRGAPTPHRRSRPSHSFTRLGVARTEEMRPIWRGDPLRCLIEGRLTGQEGAQTAFVAACTKLLHNSAECYAASRFPDPPMLPWRGQRPQPATLGRKRTSPLTIGRALAPPSQPHVDEYGGP